MSEISKNSNQELLVTINPIFLANKLAVQETQSRYEDINMSSSPPFNEIYSEKTGEFKSDAWRDVYIKLYEYYFEELITSDVNLNL